VSNAGVVIPGMTELLPPEAYVSSMAVNFFAPVSLTYELLPDLKRTRGSRVVIVGSMAGFMSLPSNAAYNASKHAVEAYCDTLRVEMRPFGVRVALLEPGGMKTPLASSYNDAWLKTFNAAPEERKKSYGQAWAEKVYGQNSKSYDAMLSDPSIVVKDLVHAVRADQPKPRYVCGNAANFFFKPLSLMPYAVRDTICEKMAYPVKPDGVRRSKL